MEVISPEARITVGGVELTAQQSGAVRMAVTCLMQSLQDERTAAQIGAMADSYVAACGQVLAQINVARVLR